MDVQTLTMDPSEAAARLLDYRAELRRRSDAEYEAVAVGLEALAGGRAVLFLAASVASGGFDERGRPRLAIARADRRQVHFRWSAWWSGPPETAALFEADGRDSVRSEYNLETLRRRLDLSAHLAAVPEAAVRQRSPYVYTYEGYALVPMIPAEVRQTVPRFRADRRFVLWEVEQWSDRPLMAQPDRDPYLLRHLGGDAYSVEAAWDLTPLERAVMAGRAR